MVAVPFTETAIFKGMNNGAVIHVPLTISDVVGEFAVAPDGNSQIQLPTDQPYKLIDIIVVTGGTDTKFQDVFVNSLATSIKIDNKSNLNTSNNRQFQYAPIAFKAGAVVKLKQTA